MASRWSTNADREFHDAQFTAVDRDPFSLSYPGYLTIRRFADLAERSLDGVRTAVDLGCGPGEITCELARRRPDVRFLGVDHSDVGIETARGHAERLRLSNVTFERQNLESYRPATPIDLVMMFDAFHHVLDPAALVASLKPAKFFLIEPAGTWRGDWDRAQDLDWLPETIGQIRQRLEHQFDFTSQMGDGPAPTPPAAGAAPTEHRYTLDDFERVFSGYSLSVRGTIAGLERYGPRPADRSELRNRFGALTYDLVVSLEDTLYAEGLDLAAKHWAIAAVPGPRVDPAGGRARRRAARPLAAPGLLPAYGVEYGEVSAPVDRRRGDVFTLTVRLTNTGWLDWDSAAASPVFASYHWLDAAGRTLVRDGRRTPFAAVVRQGESALVELQVEAPDQTGDLTLAIDLVHEGRTWFSEQSAATRQVKIKLGN